MSKEFKTFQGSVQNKSWDERVVEVKDWLVTEYHQQPLNFTVMLVCGLIAITVICSVIGMYIPVTDPSR